MKKASSPPPEPSSPKPKKTVHDYVSLIETVARVEYSRLPNHLIDLSELVNIGAIAIHVLLTSHPETEFNVTYLSTAIKWAVRNELRYRYKWYSLKTVAMDKDEEGGVVSAEDADNAEAERTQAREAIYETILSVDSLLDAENPHEIRDESYTPEERTELKEMARIVREAIAKLPPRERQIIEARFYHNMKMREIGDKFNISPSRISRIVQSGLDKIKLELKRKGYSQ
ncbi:MAG: sigma-70 family RNA polymerase sigma factor [Vampirovibrionales bacterium]|nr:sigma-70 family RNA polymerase sigma factor [Vampirovibrionales bacterium]